MIPLVHRHLLLIIFLMIIKIESKQKKRTKISKETSKILYNWIVSHNE